MRRRQGIHQNVHCVSAHIVLARGELLDLLTTTAEKRDGCIFQKGPKNTPIPVLASQLPTPPLPS